MSLTNVKLGDSDDVWGKHRVTTQDCTGDASYPTNGYAVTAAQFGMRIIYGMVAVGGNAASFAYMWVYNQATGKLQAYNPTTGAEVAGNPNFSAVTPRMLVYGE